MRKFYYLSVLALAIPVLLSAQVKKEARISKSCQAITFDGIADETVWSECTPQDINTIYGSELFTDDADLTASFKSFYNDTALFIYVEVIDDILIAAEQHYKGDKVEIYLGLPGYDEAEGATKQYSRQFAVMGDGANIWGSGGNMGSSCCVEQYPEQQDEYAGFTYGRNISLTGYSIEMAIAKLSINYINFATDTIAFEVVICDNDDIAEDAEGTNQTRNRKCWNTDGLYNDLDTEPWNKFFDIGFMTFAPSATICEVQNGNDIVMENSISVYPNPATDKISVTTKSAVNISIFNLQGAEVITRNGVKEVNIGSLAKGLYNVRIANNNGEVLKTARFIKK